MCALNEQGNEKEREGERAVVWNELLLNNPAHQSGGKRTFRIFAENSQEAGLNFLLNIHSANIVVSPAVLPVH